ncbi:MAG: MarR family transcriptional regulator, partial [Janthinobacterium lividum]
MTAGSPGCGGGRGRTGRASPRLGDVAAAHLTSAPEPVGPGEPSGRPGTTPGATTELVDRLERAGHLERRRDTQDRGRVQL